MVPEARKWPRHAGGPILRVWRPFWTHLGPFSSILGQTASLRPEHCGVWTIETSETPQLRLLRPQHCGVWTIEISETSTLCVETEQMSSVETTQMYAVEKTQMSSAGTRQMSPSQTGQRPV